MRGLLLSSGSVKAGLKRAVAQGVKLGRPKIDSATERKVRKQRSAESDVPMLTAFRRGLNETGYVVGIYCAAMLLARMTSPQSLISRLSSELAASGVCWSGGNSSMPPSSNV